MIKCGKSVLPECEYFTTWGCIFPFGCPYKIADNRYSTPTISISLNTNNKTSNMTVKKEIFEEKKDLQKYIQRKSR